MGTNLDRSTLEGLVDEQTREWVLSVVREATAREETAITAMLVQKLRDIARPVVEEGPAASSAEWIGIESLSRLRSVVGGRFQNIKKKWVDAGFPLREHRGDRWKDFEINHDAWLELAAWIAKQGFEARLTPDSEEFIFQLKSQG